MAPPWDPDEEVLLAGSSGGGILLTLGGHEARPLIHRSDPQLTLGEYEDGQLPIL